MRSIIALLALLVSLLSVHAPARAFHADGMASSYAGLQWHLAAANVRSAWRFTKGAHATICSVDTGVAQGLPDVSPAILDGIDTADIGTPHAWADDEGHGTFTASEMVARGTITQGVAPRARLLVAKVLGADGTGSDASVTEGIFWCVAHGANVINMSLGGQGDEYSGIADVVQYACSRGVAFAVSQGNDGQDEANIQPANVNSPCLVAVAATDKHGQLARFSNFGENRRSVAAPGVNVLGETPTGGVTFMSGTSMAAPIVSGELALLMSLGADARTAVAITTATARQPVDTSAKTPRWTVQLGYGLVNVGAAVGFYIKER